MPERRETAGNLDFFAKFSKLVVRDYKRDFQVHEVSPAGEVLSLTAPLWKRRAAYYAFLFNCAALGADFLSTKIKKC